MSGPLPPQDADTSRGGLQRIPQPLRRSYPVVRLYLDDVQELVRLFQTHCDRVTIRAEGYRVQSLDDLKGLPRRTVHRFDVEGFAGDTYLQVELGRAYATLYLSRDDDTTLHGVFARLDVILRRRALVLQRLNAPVTYLTVLASLFIFDCGMTGPALASLGQVVRGFILNRAHTLYFSGFRPSDIWQVSLLLAYTTYMLQWIIISRRFRSTVYLYPWNERSSFWERHKEVIVRDVIVGVIVGLIVGALAFIGGYLTGLRH